MEPLPPSHHASLAVQALARLFSVFLYSSQAAERTYGVDLAELAFLKRVAAHSPAHIDEIAHDLPAHHSEVSFLAKRLERKKLLRRIALPTRSVAFEPTALGVNLALSAPTLMTEKISAALRAMPEARLAQIRLALEDLCAAVGADALSGLFTLEQPSGRMLADAFFIRKPREQP